MKLFVYGTLMKNQCNHRHLQDATFICEDEMSGYNLINLGLYPAAVQTTDSIKGEVYEINEEILENCDYLERYPSMYNRVLKTTKSGHETWIYYLPFINNNWRNTMPDVN